MLCFYRHHTFKKIHFEEVMVGKNAKISVNSCSKRKQTTGECSAS